MTRVFLNTACIQWPREIMLRHRSSRAPAVNRPRVKSRAKPGRQDRPTPGLSRYSPGRGPVLWSDVELRSRHPLCDARHRQSSNFLLCAPTMPRQAGILNDALDAVGHTPLLRLDRIAKDRGLKCNLCRSIRLPGS